MELNSLKARQEPFHGLTAFTPDYGPTRQELSSLFGGGFTGHQSQHAHGRAGVCLDFLMLNPKLSPSPWAARSPGTCVVRDSFFGTCLQVRVYQFAHDRPQGPLLGQLQAHFQDLPGHLQREPVQLVCAPPERPG